VERAHLLLETVGGAGSPARAAQALVDGQSRSTVSHGTTPVRALRVEARTTVEVEPAAVTPDTRSSSRRNRSQRTIRPASSAGRIT
jgi:hypothetical protein